VASGDLDGDGKLDMVVSSDDGVSWFKGAGDGTFGAGVDLAASAGTLMAASDLNGDGKVDIVTAAGNAAGTNVSVILNQGAGNFGAAASYDAGVKLVSMAVGDLNGDGMPDLALGNASGNTISLFLNQGNGALGLPALVAAGQTAQRLSIADIDGDGTNDLVASTSGATRVLMNQGNAVFAAPQSYPSLASDNLVVGDMSGDGKPDVVGIKQGNARVFLNQGGGVFAPAIESPLGASGSGTALHLSDMNADAKPDLVFAYGEDVVVLLGQGGGALGPPSAYPGLGTFVTGFIAPGDFTGDGKPDVAVIDDITFEPGSLFTFVNKGDGALYSGVSFPDVFTYDSIGVHDLNGDGKLDIVGASASGVGVLLNQGGAFSAASYPAVIDGFPAFAAADLNGDGSADLAVTAMNQDKLSVLLNQGGGAFGAATEYETGPKPRDLVAADLNGDGKVDLAVVPSEDVKAQVFFNNGDGTFALAVAFDVGAKLEEIEAGDFDGDGSIDLAVLGADDFITFLLNDGAGAFVTGFKSGAPQGNAMTAADLNGDSKADIVINVVSMFWYVSVRLNNGDGTFAGKSFVYTKLGSFIGRVGVGDLNGDGSPDLAIPENSEDLMEVYANDGDGSSFTFVGRFASTASDVVAADVTGDGRADLVSSYLSATIIPSVCLP
jgi:hypothetical protein